MTIYSYHSILMFKIKSLEFSKYRSFGNFFDDQKITLKDQPITENPPPLSPKRNEFKKGLF
jgi:hypothetical protein